MVDLLRSPDLTERIEMAWNLGGPGLYQEHLEYLQKQPLETVVQSRIYMTKVHKTFKSDVFYPTKIWSEIKHQFRELDVCDDIPDLNQVINEDDNVNISFHVYELKTS